MAFDLNLNPFRESKPSVSAAPAHAPSVDPAAPLIVYGTGWCGDCARSKRFLDRHAVPYRWIDVDDDPEAARRIVEINHGRRSVPTIVFPDGATLTEPSDAQLARKLGMATR